METDTVCVRVCEGLITTSMLFYFPITLPTYFPFHKTACFLICYGASACTCLYVLCGRVDEWLCLSWFCLRYVCVCTISLNISDNLLIVMKKQLTASPVKLLQVWKNHHWAKWTLRFLLIDVRLHSIVGYLSIPRVVLSNLNQSPTSQTDETFSTIPVCVAVTLTGKVRKEIKTWILCKFKDETLFQYPLVLFFLSFSLKPLKNFPGVGLAAQQCFCNWIYHCLCTFLR